MENNPLSLTLVRTFDAPIEKVWDAWTTAEGWDGWYGNPLEVRKGETEFDPTVGGTWKSTTIGEEGDIKFHGIFKEITAPHKLVMTMEVEGFSSDKEETVTALFKELEDGKTEMTFTQAGGNVPAEEYANGLKQGWTGFFDALEKYVTK